MFKKILIANRGEIAVRIVRACRDLGVSPVAVYSDVDRDSLHVKLVDQAVGLAGTAASESYLDVEKIIAAARKTGAEAVHPGYGFLSESEQLAEACQSSGIVFIGPGLEPLKIMGSKIESRRAAQEAGVRPVPGDDLALTDLEEACRRAAELGYPVMLKANAGGGGKGLRQIQNEEELRAAFEMAKGEAASSFGDATVYLEKEITRARHLEVQVLGDQYGNLVHLAERECSIQRRHQKILEEAPSPIATPELRRALGEAALQIAGSVGYQNAGTVEFLVDADDPRRFYFLEMNTRLQVEHAVTEMVTGIDLVCEQIRIAAGEELGFRQDRSSFAARRSRFALMQRIRAGTSYLLPEQLQSCSSQEDLESETRAPCTKATPSPSITIRSSRSWSRMAETGRSRSVDFAAHLVNSVSAECRRTSRSCRRFSRNRISWRAG